MSLDYKAILIARVWTLLEASSDFTTAFKAARRIKKNTSAGWLRELHGKAPADFPRIAVDLKGGTLPPGYNRTFGMNSTGFTSSTCDSSVPFTQQVAISITYDKVSTGDQTPLEAIVTNILMQNFPKFGISWVQNFSFTESRAEVSVGGVRRDMYTMLVTFQCREKLSVLAA